MLFRTILFYFLNKETQTKNQEQNRRKHFFKKESNRD